MCGCAYLAHYIEPANHEIRLWWPNCAWHAAVPSSCAWHAKPYPLRERTLVQGLPLGRAHARAVGLTFYITSYANNIVQFKPGTIAD